MRLYQGDCLEIMPRLDPKSVDMVLCDLPYGRTRNKWDTQIPLDKLWAEFDRIVKDNGVRCLFTKIGPADQCCNGEGGQRDG